MKKSRNPKHILSDLHPNMGPGLFTDPRAQESADRLHKCCIRFLQSLPEKEKITLAISKSELSNALMDVARYYWSDTDYEDRVKRSEIKHELIEIRPALASILCKMKGLSSLAKQAINIEIARGRKTSAFKIDDQLSTAFSLMRTVARANTSFVKPVNKRTGGVRIKRACRKLIALWEAMSKQKFRKGFQSVAERSESPESPSDQFVNISSQFVFVMLKSIDPSINFGTVRNGLRAASGPPRRGRQKVRASTPIAS